MPQNVCPRYVGLPDYGIDYSAWPDDGHCHQCGSLNPDTFMARLEAGTISIDPTDKNYKVYVHNDGGDKFKRSHLTDKPSVPGEIMKDPRDQSLWTFATEERDDTKFYFQHLSVNQMQRFVELLNEKKLKLNAPGYFYRPPFFVQTGAK